MSGLEIAGLVLGLWPVMQVLVSSYSQAKDARGVRHLRNQLCIYRLLFQGFINEILLGDEELSDEDKVCLKSEAEISPTFETPWKDADLESRLRKRLGDEKVNTIIFTLQETYDSLKMLENRLRLGDVDFTTIRGKLRSTFHQIRTSMPGSDVQKDMTRVQQSIDNLRRIVEITNPLPHSTRLRPSAPTSRRVSVTHRQKKRLAAEHVCEFFSVLKGSFHCQCTSGHETNIRIYDDLFHILFGIDEMQRSISNLTLGSRTTFETEITAIQGECLQDGENDSTSDNHTWSISRRCSTSSLGRERRALPLLFSMNRPGSGSGAPKIPDMCHFVKKLEQLDQQPPSPSRQISSVGTLGSGDRSYTARIYRDPDPMKPTWLVCLDDHIFQTDDWQISRQIRIDIAQKLACSIIQFWTTSLIDSAWTWRNFSMHKESNKRPQLYVTRTLYSAENKNEQPVKLGGFWRFLPEPILVRLGFALIELALGKRLSQLRVAVGGETEEVDKDNKDARAYDTARELVERNVLRDQIGDTYQAIVLACLTCTVIKDTGAVALTSATDTFQEDVEENIIQPLQDYFSRNWASVVAVEG